MPSADAEWKDIRTFQWEVFLLAARMAARDGTWLEDVLEMALDGMRPLPGVVIDGGVVHNVDWPEHWRSGAVMWRRDNLGR